MENGFIRVFPLVGILDLARVRFNLELDLLLVRLVDVAREFDGVFHARVDPRSIVHEILVRVD